MLPESVQLIGQLHLDGNIVPHSWYSRPELQYENGKPNLVAITLLSDMLYWYRPTMIRDEATGQVVELRKKFSSDKLQKSHQQWADQFGLSKRQVEDAVKFLRDNSLITTELRTLMLAGRPTPNVLFLEPIVERIRELNKPHLNEVARSIGGYTPTKCGTSPAEKEGTPRQDVACTPIDGETNTETTTQTSPETTTEEDVVLASGSNAFHPIEIKPAAGLFETLSPINPGAAAQAKSAAKGDNEYDLFPGFKAFWDAYPKCPRKTGKSECLKIWKKKGLEKRANAVVRGVKRLSKTDDWRKQNGEFIPLVATFLNGARWDTGDDDGDDGAAFSGGSPVVSPSGLVVSKKRRSLAEIEAMEARFGGRSATV